MQEYADKETFISEIKKTAMAFIIEYDTIAEADKALRMEESERTPFENLAYQLGWMALIQQWEQGEKYGEKAEMPAPGIKWNQLGLLHEKFYADYKGKGLGEMTAMFNTAVDTTCQWIESIEDDVLFQPGGRNWAQSTPANWPVWKWVHINTVAPFKSFRSKVRKWKKLRAAQ